MTYYTISPNQYTKHDVAALQLDVDTVVNGRISRSLTQSVEVQVACHLTKTPSSCSHSARC